MTHTAYVMRCYSPVQVRASVDYSSDPTQYHIGYTSMFAEAVGVAPFKDNFWTTSVQPGNPGSKLMFTGTCLGPLVLRGTVGVRHDGLPRQVSPLLPVVCQCLCLCEGCASPLRDVVSPPLFRPIPSSLAFDCSLQYHFG